MTRTSTLLALCSALAIPDAVEGADVPEWIQVLPAGAIRTIDGRGPYHVKSMQAVAAASLKAGQKLVLDECHATDRAKVSGQSAPARGWIVELDARDDGLWGRVEWTPTGHQLMAEKAYRGVSPVIVHTQSNEVLGVLRASLTNTPNLTGMIALHSENVDMDWKAKLIELLGLDSEADDAAIEAALKAKMEASADAGGAAAAEHDQQLGDSEAIVALQTELEGVTSQLNALRDDRAREKAVAFVDGAIAEGRVGVKPLRDRYISMHMANPADVEAIIGAKPKLSGSTHADGTAPEADASGLSAADRQVIALMGLDEEKYKESLAASGKKEEAL